MRTTAVFVFFGLLWLVAACSGERGPAGLQGPPGENGDRGETGAPGQPGSNGEAGVQGPQGATGDAGPTGATGATGTTGATGATGASGHVEIPLFHGSAAIETLEGQAGKVRVTPTITSAEATASGQVTVHFQVTDKSGTAVLGVTSVAANIARLDPPSGSVAYNQWVPYIYRAAQVTTSGEWPAPAGTSADQGWRETGGALTDHGDGTYDYVFTTNIASVTRPVSGAAVGYDRTRTHRVALFLGGSTGPTGNATFDFVPAGGALPDTRDIVRSASCQECHSEDLEAHHGEATLLEGCVTCHNPSSTDPYSGNTLDMDVLIHKVHAGGELATVPGPDGIVWDNPATAIDESADNGHYAIWDDQGQKREWWKVGFPAVLENCQKCHHGSGADVDNWKLVPSRTACGSCHDDVDFATGANHGGGQVVVDDFCAAACHKPGGLAPTVEAAHDWMAKWSSTNPAWKDLRKVPEFTLDVTLDPPANGQYYAGSEAPRVHVVIKEGGVAIDHTTVLQDTCTGSGCVAAEGCTQGADCPPRDGLFTGAALYVDGPRARRNPVLTYAARARVYSGAGPTFDLTNGGTANPSLNLNVDGGKSIYVPTLVSPLSGTLSVPVSSFTTANPGSSPAAAAVGEIAAWLNADAAFAARAIAYVEPVGGTDRVFVRSRNLGDFYAVQLQPSSVTTTVFGGDTTTKSVGSAANQLYQCVSASCVPNPMVTWTTGEIVYQLDPVTDLAPGTYVVNLEIADRGRVDTNNYKTPSVKKVPFQVKVAAEEAPPARGCDSCHQQAGKGFILDFSRHYKIFDDTAVDQCQACHDHQSSTATGAWTGGMAIARRVHGVHYGSSLSYPLNTVGYGNGDPVAGRNWDITLPQNPRRCDGSCHGPGTSGSWSTEPSRMPCWGCHDSLSNQAHFKTMTYDPTPSNPWSGDEEEACITCHAAD